MFEITINAIGIDVGAPSEEELAAGAPPLLTYAIQAGLQLPISAGPGQPPMPALPFGVIRFGLPKPTGLSYAELILGESDKLPDPPPESDLIIADSLHGADKLAKQFQDLSGT